MTKDDILKALDSVDEKYVKSIDVFYRTLPNWRCIMKRSVKFAVTAAAVIFTVGVIAVVMFLQGGPQAAPPAGRPVSSQPEEDGVTTLKVVSEFASSPIHGGYSASPVYEALINIAAEYNLSHKDQKVQVQMLPVSGTEREIELERLRTEIMAGSGPDIFVLPAGSVAGMDQNDRPIYGMEGLFPDVESCMRNELFADLSCYYDEDAELKTEELKQEIMDAGVYGGKRYVLPIGWNMPAVCVDNNKLRELGLDSSLFSAGICDAYDAILRSENDEVVSSAKPTPYLYQLCLFPGVIDYDKGTSLLREEDILDYFQKKKAIEEAPRAENLKAASNVSSYLYNPDFAFALDGQMPFYCSDLTECVEMLGIAKTKDANVSVLPIPCSDGTLAAEVTYFGAVSAGSSHPAEAYEFLRMFLMPEVQFQLGYDGIPISIREVNCAWPVRIPGSVSAQWRSARAINPGIELNGKGVTEQRKKELSQVELTDGEFPILEETIDHVRFSTSLSYEFALQTNDLSDPQQAVQDFLTQLKYHIAES